MPPEKSTPTPALPLDAPAAATASDAAHTFLDLDSLASDLDALDARLLGAPAAPLPTDYPMQAAPRISPALFAEVLALAESPAAAENTADALWRIPVSYGLDPGVALAFFFHESKYGTLGVARTTLGWGNMRVSEGNVYPRRDFGEGRGLFAVYPNYRSSLDDWCRYILRRYVQRGLLTVAQIVPVYAPSTDNNRPPAYIASVVRAVTAWHRLSGPGPFVARDGWEAWGTLFPLGAQQYGYSIPRRWLAEGNLGAARSPELYDFDGRRSMQWFERGLIVWLGGERTEVVR